MDKNMLEEALFLDIYNDAVDYLECHDDILFSYNKMPLDKIRNRLNKTEMQFIIDLAESVRLYSNLNSKKISRKKVHFKRLSRVNFQSESV